MDGIARVEDLKTVTGSLEDGTLCIDEDEIDMLVDVLASVILVPKEDN